MSWLFSQALVAEYSQATAWAGAPCAQLSVMPTQHKFWRNDKTMEPCDLSRFGLTCAALTEDRGADLLTWFREASHARTSALPARAQALTESEAGCGLTWRGSLARFDPASRSWRTAQPSLLGDSEECSVTWPRSGMTAGGQCWELPTLAPPHQRDRFWLVGADTLRDRCEADHGREPVCDGDGHGAAHAAGWQEQQPGPCGECGHVADTHQQPWHERRARDTRQGAGGRHADRGIERPHLRHADSTRLEEREGQPSHARQELTALERADWWTVEPDVGRVADGVAHRVDRLKALGNGQVPQCAATAWRMLTDGVRNTHNV